ncbi:MAG TPA: AraC family transcriptional regulator [Candidatus Acidoferrales bacterium]|nr:AraC family transcriptional regulator [Candidatus Acidoferrales bacterium]
MTQPQQSTLASWSATIVRALDAHGLDGRGIALQAGIDPTSLHEPDGRIPRAALTRLWSLAVDATSDSCFGLTVARFPMQTTFHALGYAVLASTTFREALERIIRYRRLIGDVVQLSIEERGDCCRFIIDVSSRPGAVPYEAIDAFTAVTVRQARMLHGSRNFNPLAVSLQRPRPFNAQPFERLFRAPLAFSQPMNFLEYAKEDLDRRLPAGNAELARQNDEVVVRYLARVKEIGLANRVEQALIEALPNGEPSKQAIARNLAMSPRNLQRRLAEEGTSFKQILNDARVSLARSYLAEGRLPVTEIAFVLGFADTSAFSRAFKRWTGKSPRDYGKRS